jgi:hypothetical protein
MPAYNLLFILHEDDIVIKFTYYTKQKSLCGKQTIGIRETKDIRNPSLENVMISQASWRIRTGAITDIYERTVILFISQFFRLTRSFLNLQEFAYLSSEPFEFQESANLSPCILIVSNCFGLFELRDISTGVSNRIGMEAQELILRNNIVLALRIIRNLTTSSVSRVQDCIRGHFTL